MATRIALGGNFTAAGSWAEVSAVSGAYSDSEASINLASGLGYAYSPTFTLAAVDVDAVALKIYASTGVGTADVILANDTSPGTREGVVTVNTSDFAGTSGNIGWVLFKFGSVVSPNGTDLYKIGIRTSTAATVTPYRSSTGSSLWSRMVRLTSTGAPAVNDQLHVLGEWTAAGTKTDITITMNNTATTSFGPTVSGGPPQGITVGKGGIWTNGSTASTNYYFKWKGIFAVYSGGVFNCGTSTTPIPDTSSAIYEMDSVANVDTGFIAYNGAIVNRYGAVKDNTITKLVGNFGGYCWYSSSKTFTRIHGLPFNDATLGYAVGDTFVFGGSNYTIATISADTITYTVQTATSGTSLYLPKSSGNNRKTITLDNVDLSTWKDGDVIAIGTSGLGSQYSETAVIAASGINNTTKTITFTTELLYGHLDCAEMANSQCRCEVLNLTRNVKFRGMSTSLQGFETYQATSVTNTQYCEFQYYGSTVNQKYGIWSNTTSGTFIVEHCALHDFGQSGYGIYVQGTSGQTTSTWKVNDVCSYYLGNALVSFPSTTGTYTLTNCVSMITYANSNSTSGFVLTINGGTISNLTASSVAGVACLRSMILYGSNSNGSNGTVSGLTVHNSDKYGLLSISDVSQSVISDIVCYRAQSGFGVGLKIGRVSNVVLNNVLLLDCYIAIGPGFNDNVMTGNITINNGIFGRGVYYNGVYGFNDAATTSGTLRLELNNCNFIPTTATYSGFTGTDLALGTLTKNLSIITNNCTFASVSNSNTTLTQDCIVTAQRLNGTAGNHKTWMRFGVCSVDTAIYATASPSARLTPNSASGKLYIAPPERGYKVPVASGATATVSVKVRSSLSTDTGGANYNGNYPRLILRKNYAAGITEDVVLATGTAAYAPGGGSQGQWETLTGTTAAVTDDAVLEFIVDCDGTAGWINVDDWS
jgi:hypothetical protein